MSDNLPLVSVIIPSYNRFEFLEKAIESVQNQSHRSVEIIVVDDASPDPRYKAYAGDRVQMINLETNSRQRFGFPCPGYVRNQGIAVAKGEYIGFLDDDDTWFPNKVSSQLAAMSEQSIPFSCTEAVFGHHFQEAGKHYPLYNAEYYHSFYLKLLRKHFKIEDGFIPETITSELLHVHNCIITSSVIMKRSILDLVGGFGELDIGAEDYDLWKRVIQHTPCIYLREPHVYYDGRWTRAGKQGLKVKLIKGIRKLLR